MGVGTSVLLIAVGAVLDFAISVTNSHGFNIHTIGLILMIVGGIGLLLSMMFWGSWGGFGGYRRDVVVDHGAGMSRRRVVEDEVL